MIARLALAGLLLVAGTANADDVVVSATVDPPALHVGETADLTVTVEGKQSSKRPTIEDTAGLAIQYVGPSSEVSIVNGHMSSSVSHRFIVAGSKPGHYEVGPVRVDVDGAVKDAGRVAIDILAANAPASGNAPSGSREITLELVVPRTDVYLHERIPLELTLRIGAVRVDGLQYPVIPSEGFALEDFPEPKQRREQGPRGEEHVVQFSTWLTPLKQGPLTVGPATMGMSVVMSRGRRTSFLGNVFGDEMKPTQVLAAPLTLNVLPLPAAGKPADFSGAVGKFTMKVSVAPHELTVGDPVTVTSVVRGSGSLDGVAPPAIAGSEALRVYPVQGARSDDKSARTFEQVVIPLHEGTTALVGPSFSYFDPEARSYRRVGAEPVTLAVRRSTNPEAKTRIVGGTAPSEPAPRVALGRDLVFIKDAPGKLVPIGERRSRRAGFWALQGLPLGLWLGATAFDRRRRRLAGDTRYARFTRAGRAAKGELAQARAALAANDLGACHDRAAGALREYLAAKLDLAPGAVEEQAPAELRAAGIDAELVDEVDRFFATSADTRFAPSAVSRADLEKTLDRADDLLRRLERTRRIKQASAAVLLVGLALAAASVVQAATADDKNPTALFFSANALYSNEQYAEAAEVYEKVLASHVESGALYYNLGNAYFKAGDVGRAVLAYERARRIIPGDPDLVANLAFAREQAADPQGESLVARLAFPLAERSSTDSLLGIAAASWWILLLTLTLRVLVPKVEKAARWVAIAATVLVVVAASSAAFRYETLEHSHFAVLTSDSETTVRYEPSPNGTAFYNVKPGTVLRIVGEREGWNRVATRDGRRGWVETATLTLL